ncbi:hypothetical protein ACTXGO_00795 [Psychrobacter sp. T6-1]|uniref:hypothetical protein n=1 Tax=Psychrobacter sp. T6-1 TaxID=3457447 RepID=UPI003FD189E3
MFTDLFQLEQKPVTVFSSADTNAPILTKDPGSLKTLLKACLITGYGDKASLGWEMAFESEDQKSAAFKSTDPTASQFYFKIDNSGTTTALLSAYQTMTAIDNGAQPIAIDNIYDLHASSWRLIGHSKAFILVLDISVKGDKIAYPILFGDLPRQVDRVEPLCVLWSARKNKESNYPRAGGLQAVLFAIPNGNYHDAGYGPTSGIKYQVGYPLRINSSQASQNLNINTCRFSYDSFHQATALYDYVLSALNDSTWTFIPMMLPISSKIGEALNLSLLDSSTIMVSTGYEPNDPQSNSACAIPIDWWYA